MDSLQFLYKTIPGRFVLKLLASRPVSKLCGAYLDSKASYSLIKSFAEKNKINLEDYELTDVKTFNQFFRRKIKDGKRPFDFEVTHLPSPCDGLLTAYNITDENGNATVIPVKQSRYTINSLLQNKELASRFTGGLCLVFRLCVDNYHRYAYPVSGTKSQNTFIPGVLHTVRPIALETLPVFTQNCREYTVINSSEFGTIVQMEVGAMLVGRIVNHHQEGKIERSAEKGYFEYGGSTIILLLEKDTIRLREDIKQNSLNGKETPVLMGECIAEK